MAEITKSQVTAEEFFRLPETMRKTELIDGEVIIEMPPKHIHQKLVALLHLLLVKLAPGGEVCLSPSAVHLDDNNVPEPDLFWVAGPESRCKLGEDGWWHGAPDLVVEVFSPSTAVYDRREKFRLYEKHGVREYWMVDPILQFVEVWELVEGKFQQKGIYAANEAFESMILGGKTVELSALFPGVSVGE